MSFLQGYIPGLCQPDTNRSLYWFYRDASIYLQVKGSTVVYAVWASKLADTADFFGDLLALPQAAETTVDDDVSTPRSGNGATEATPLEIQAGLEQFEVFLECVFGSSTKSHPVSFWLMALEMADFFNAASITHTAQRMLGVSKDLNPVTRLNLAMHYRLTDWLEPSVSAIVRRPLSLLTQQQITAMGFSAYIILAEAATKILEHRAVLAANPPAPIHHSSCEKPAACHTAWSHAWWGEAAKHGVAIALIHSSQTPASSILPAVENMHASWQMPLYCRRLTIEHIVNHPEVFLREERFIAQAVKRLSRL
ncbi:hypothetical protein R3P38DRAFT_2549510 [Favolaschia claudopus]|uniref:BTB domain-containing protein n=1 Tax=Favolaschia claudopus TaxID=2862362 RepID=A0AAW0AJP6_9AGAR